MTLNKKGTLNKVPFYLEYSKNIRTFAVGMKIKDLFKRRKKTVIAEKECVPSSAVDMTKLMKEIDRQIRFYTNSDPGSSEYCKGIDDGALTVLNWFKKNMSYYQI